MPTMIQMHLIICKDWADVKDKAKSLKHTIQKCNPPTNAMPLMATGATVPGFYSHIAHSVDKEEGKIPQPFKGAKPKQTRGRGKPKEKPQNHRPSPPKAQKTDETYAYDSPNNYYHNDNYTAPSQNHGRRPFNGQVSNRQFRGFTQETEAKDPNIININFRTFDFREAHINRTVLNMATTANPTFREVKQITTEVKAMTGVLSNLEDAAVVGQIIGVITALTNISITHTINRQNSTAHPVAYAVVSTIPLSTATKENMTKIILWKRSVLILTNGSRVIYINSGDHDIPHEPPQNELEGCDISQNTLYSHHTDVFHWF